jgi:hypothetical protein
MTFLPEDFNYLQFEVFNNSSGYPLRPELIESTVSRAVIIVSVTVFQSKSCSTSMWH